MLEPKRVGEILRKHFAEVTTEQFIENLKTYCSEVLQEDSLNQSEEPNLSKTVKHNFIASEVKRRNDE